MFVTKAELLAAVLVLDGCDCLINEDFLDERGRDVVGGVLGRFLVGQDEFLVAWIVPGTQIGERRASRVLGIGHFKVDDDLIHDARSCQISGHFHDGKLGVKRRLEKCGNCRVHRLHNGAILGGEGTQVTSSILKIPLEEAKPVFELARGGRVSQD